MFLNRYTEPGLNAAALRAALYRRGWGAVLGEVKRARERDGNELIAGLTITVINARHSEEPRVTDV